MKDYVVLMDSVGDLSEDLRELDEVILVPLTIQIKDEHIIAGKGLDQDILLEKIKAADYDLKTACPSPGMYLDLFRENKDKKIYVVCCSDKLSGSYSSAATAEHMFRDEYPDSRIAVFNSESASAGPGLQVHKIIEKEDAGLDFETIVEEMNAFIPQMVTTFVLEDLNFLYRAGRLSKLEKLGTDLLHISLILVGNRGEIECKSKVIGNKKAIMNMTSDIIADLHSKKVTMLQISHVNALKKAERIRDKIREDFPELTIYLTNTYGCATLYAGEGGVVVSY